MEPSKREIDAALRPLEDQELAKLMKSAARGAHESRRLKWQAEADELINREREYSGEATEKWEQGYKRLLVEWSAADRAYREQFHRAEVLKVRVENHRLVMVILLAVIGILVVLRWV